MIVFFNGKQLKGRLLGLAISNGMLLDVVLVNVDRLRT